MKIPEFNIDRPIWMRSYPRFQGDDDSRTIIWLFPGMSLMKVERTGPHSMEVTCPGCGAVMKVYKTPPASFVHETDDCPILLRIEEAARRFRAMGYSLP